MWLYLHQCWRRPAVWVFMACVCIFIACVDTLSEFVIQVGEIRAPGSCRKSSAVERPADSCGTSNVPWRILPKVLLSTKLWMNSEMKQRWTDSWQLTEQKNETIVAQFECRNAIISHLLLWKLLLFSAVKLGFGLDFLHFYLCIFPPKGLWCVDACCAWLTWMFQAFASADVALLPEAPKKKRNMSVALTKTKAARDGFHTHWNFIAGWPPTETAPVGSARLHLHSWSISTGSRGQVTQVRRKAASSLLIQANQRC